MSTELRQWAIDRAMTHLGAESHFDEITALAGNIVAFIDGVNLPIPGQTWTDARVALLKTQWGTERAAAHILYALNDLPGRSLKRGGMWQKAASLGLYRPPSPKGDSARRAGLIMQQRRHANAVVENV